MREEMASLFSSQGTRAVAERGGRASRLALPHPAVPLQLERYALGIGCTTIRSVACATLPNYCATRRRYGTRTDEKVRLT